MRFSAIRNKESTLDKYERSREKPFLEIESFPPLDGLKIREIMGSRGSRRTPVGEISVIRRPRPILYPSLEIEFYSPHAKLGMCHYRLELDDTNENGSDTIRSFCGLLESEPQRGQFRQQIRLLESSWSISACEKYSTILCHLSLSVAGKAALWKGSKSIFDECLLRAIHTSIEWSFGELVIR